jgi:hypothetical protein
VVTGDGGVDRPVETFESTIDETLDTAAGFRLLWGDEVYNDYLRANPTSVVGIIPRIVSFD